MAAVVALTEHVLLAVLLPAPVKVKTGDAEFAIEQPVELAATTEYVIGPELEDAALAKVKGLDSVVVLNVGDHVKVGVNKLSSIFIRKPAPLLAEPYLVPNVAPTRDEPPDTFPPMGMDTVSPLAGRTVTQYLLTSPGIKLPVKIVSKAPAEELSNEKATQLGEEYRGVSV